MLNHITAALTTAATTLAHLRAVAQRRLTTMPQGSYDSELRSMLAEVGAPEGPARRAAAQPLSDKFRWAQAELDLPDWGQLMRVRDEGSGAYIGDEIYEAAFMAATQPYPGVIGKADTGIYPTEGAVRFELGSDDWRLIDFVRTSTEATYALPLKGLRFTKGDKALGDGVIGRVRPATLKALTGKEVVLNGREDTYLQVRAFIFDNLAILEGGTLLPDTACRKVFKGLLHVTNNTNVELFAPEAGYGKLHTVTHDDTVIIEQMLDVRDYSPRGRVSTQAGAYEGVKGWYEHFQAGYTYAADETFDGARMVLAGAPVYFLPISEVIRVARGVFQALVSIPMGVRRKVAPGPDLKAFEFRAPWELQSMFRIGERYVIHRDPALPDGTSAYSAVCIGYTWGNYFQVATNESPRARGAEFGVWEQTGGDFDGDDALVLPHHSNGGLLMGFNDRPAAEQQALMDAAGQAGRKGDDFTKRVYPSGLVRWMNQRKAAVELGMLDFRARKTLDGAGPEGKYLAAGLKPYIQAAVDRQKRDRAYPSDLRDLKPMSGEFGTKLLSFIKKPDADLQEDKTSWKHSWDICRALANTAELIVRGEEVDELIMQPAQRDAMQPVARWAVETFRALERILGHSKFADNAGYPRANFFPAKDIAAWQAARRADLGDARRDFADLAPLQDEIGRLRKRSASSARALESLLSAYAGGLADDERHELALGLSDPQTWVKVAPMDDLVEVFSGPRSAFGRNMQRLTDLPGVLVTGLGRQFQHTTADCMVSVKPLNLGGCRAEAGTVELRQVALSGSDRVSKDSAGHVTIRCERRFEIQLVQAGTVLARTAGSFQGDMQAVWQTLRAQLPTRMNMSEVEALAEWQVPAMLLISDADRELLAAWDEAKRRDADVQHLVWLAIGDDLTRLGVTR